MQNITRSVIGVGGPYPWLGRRVRGGGGKLGQISTHMIACGGPTMKGLVCCTQISHLGRK